VLSQNDGGKSLDDVLQGITHTRSSGDQQLVTCSNQVLSQDDVRKPQGGVLQGITQTSTPRVLPSSCVLSQKDDRRSQDEVAQDIARTRNSGDLQFVTSCKQVLSQKDNHKSCCAPGITRRNHSDDHQCVTSSNKKTPKKRQAKCSRASHAQEIQVDSCLAQPGAYSRRSRQIAGRRAPRYHTHK